jgi:4-amino-4-deoxy-L-arabinose transferase-like glycosyltransferase
LAHKYTRCFHTVTVPAVKKYNRKGNSIPSKFSKNITRICERHSSLLLGAVLSLALLLRILALLSLKDSVYFDYPLWDERLYHSWAESIANGTYLSSSVYEMAPLPAYLMALVYKILSPDILYIRGLNIILGVFTCYLLYFVGKALAGKTTGIISCLVACLYEPFIFYSIVPLKTALSVFLFSLSVYLFLSAVNKASYLKILFLGIAIGLMLNVRPNCLVLIPFLPLFILWNMGRKKLNVRTAVFVVAMYAVGLFMVLSPFVIRNYRVSGELALTASQSGLNLYIANNLENEVPYYRPVPFAASVPSVQGIQFNIEASRRSDSKLSSVEASRFWTREVFRIALDQPASFLWKLLQKGLASLNGFEAGDHYHIGFVSEFVRFFKFPFIILSLVFPLGMGFLVLHFRESKKIAFLSAIFLLYALTLVVFYPTSRFRLPLLVILIPFATAGTISLISMIKSKQHGKWVLYLTVITAFAVIEFLPVRGTDDMTAYYNTHAIILDSKGSTGEAVKYWKKSSEMDKPYSAYANLSLADKYAGKGYIQKALYYLDRISANSFAGSDKYERTGDIMLYLKQPGRAAAAYERSLDINSGRRRTRQKLIGIYLKKDMKKALKQYKKLEYISSFYEPRGLSR